MQELKRLFNKRLRILLIIAIIVNIGVFVYGELEGKSIREFSDENNFRQVCVEKYSNYEPNDGWKQLVEDSKAMPESDKKKYAEVIKEVKAQLIYLRELPKELEVIQANAENMKQFSIFIEEGSFSYNNILKTSKDFKRIEGLELKLTNGKAVDEFTRYSYTFYIAMGIMLLIVYNMFSERENGMWEMVHSSVKGRMHIGVVRALTLVIISIVITAVLYFTTWITAMCMYGGWRDLLTPIQTVSQYCRFTYPISKLEYVLYNYVYGWLAIYALSMVIWMLFTVCRKRNVALVLIGVFFGVETLCYGRISPKSAYALLRQVNVVRLLHTNDILGGYENRAIGGLVVSVSLITLVVLLAITVVSLSIAIVATVVMKPLAASSMLGRFFDSLQQLTQKVIWSMPMICKELHKLLFTSKGYVVIIVAVVVSLYVSSNGKVQFSDVATQLDEIYLKQGGEEYSQAEKMVEDVQKQFNEAITYAQDMSEQYEAGNADIKQLNMATGNLEYYRGRYSEISELVEKMDYLERVETEYGVKGYLISDRGYESIFGRYSKSRELVLIIVLISAIMIVISEVSLLESRTGMDSMLRAGVNGRKWLELRKVIASIILVTALFLVVYGIDYMYMIKYYGMPYLDAPIMSLTYMEGCNFNVTIAGWIMLRLLVRYIVSLLTMSVALALSKIIGKKGNRALVIIVLAVLIVVVVIIEKAGWLL